MWATWAQAPPYTKTSSAPSPAQAWSPRGTAMLGPRPCVHTPGDRRPRWEVLARGLYKIPSRPLASQPTWSFQAEIQYRLSSSSSRWMDWLRKLREAGSRGPGKDKDKPSHTVMHKGLEMELKSHAPLLFPLNLHLIFHLSFQLSTPAQQLPLSICSDFSPTSELASSRKRSKTPHCLLPWRPSQAKRPHAAYRVCNGRAFPSPEKIHSNVQVFF